MNRYAFLDRDGTLIFEPQDTYQVNGIEQLRILDGVIESLKALQNDGYRLVMVTNQDGLGTESNPQENFDYVQSELLRRFADEGIGFEAVFVCPHLIDDKCSCRKPLTGMVDEFFKSIEIDMERSFVCGDRNTDREFAENLGLPFFLIETNAVMNLDFNVSKSRSAKIFRKTNETSVDLFLDLDGDGFSQIDIPCGFFKHMLELFSRHACIDLKLVASGDLYVDDHHIIEDVALVLGQTIKQSLGDKRGINRYGSIILPMDEVLCVCAIDLSGRFAYQSNYQPVRECVNDFSTEMVNHFFQSLAVEAAMNLHFQFLNSGENEHHRIEALFKAFARSLRQAISFDDAQKNRIPSTKELL